LPPQWWQIPTARRRFHHWLARSSLAFRRSRRISSTDISTKKAAGSMVRPQIYIPIDAFFTSPVTSDLRSLPARRPDASRLVHHLTPDGTPYDYYL
jgi:hypothetical protein